MRAESKRHGRIRCSCCISLREACYFSLLLVDLSALSAHSSICRSSVELRASSV